MLVGSKEIWMLIIFCLGVRVATAQSNPADDAGGAGWRLWTGINTDIFLSRKSEISIDYLRGADMADPIVTDFHQASASVDYDFTKQISGKAGMTFTQTPSSGEFTYRVFLRGSYKMKVGDLVSWTHGLQAESHSPNENRFDYRGIYMTRFGLQHRLKLLRVAPSISYWLYYNIGGSKIQYYDTSGEPSVKETADGFHRGRLTLNVNSKLSDAASISLYYMMQNEFNLFGDSRGLNVINPSTGKIKRPFSNYNVLGLSLQFDI